MKPPPAGTAVDDFWLIKTLNKLPAVMAVGKATNEEAIAEEPS